MRKFDLKAFSKNKKNKNYYRYIKINDEGATIETYLIENKDSYQETIVYLNTPIKKRYMYDKYTLNIIKEISSFYDCIIGFRREYNEDGVLIVEIDNDAPYKFSWQNLVKKMKTEYDIDLMDKLDQIKNNNSVSYLSRNSQKMQYDIRIPCEFIPHGFPEERFEIDATTGEIITHIKNKEKIYPNANRD
ncbi:hypothetical protein OIU80_00805 [Flavobacterium sp. LS1R47]|uniref:Uncharacterized protein n=1 Tax=Flavobacterium frigoritolerans TaxID=2987686 RepID=A0A9X3C8B2_9FLAO|nr:hypothetical protein [Flavobacterium frigoritolerans]MCV9930808.1 hypothetical protein [Flavobacterium frigoritolerans]